MRRLCKHVWIGLAEPQWVIKWSLVWIKSIMEVCLDTL